jgi:large conductance mechanosensitive channel
MLEDFRAFINRGNVVDLAVAVVIGAAFGQVIAALVDQVVMPPIGLLIGGVDFSAIGWILRDADAYASVPEAVAAGAPVIQLGAFLNTLLTFLIVAFAVFLVVRLYTRTQERFKREEVGVPEDPVAVSPDTQLLTEIRDLLARSHTPPPGSQS